MTTITENLTTILQLITQYEQNSGRSKGSVQLLGASKGQSAEKILEAFEAGLHRFGENYLQEALAKMKILSDKNIEWHFIGPIQSNKIRKIAENFAWVHSVSNLKIAQGLNDRRPAHLPPLNVCIEINVNRESSKAGIDPEAIQLLADWCVSLPKLRLRGLMAIPAPSNEQTEQRRNFHTLFTLYQSLREQGYPLDTLSMGMSSDFEAAIQESATIVRIGAALFGSRPEKI